MARLAAGRLWRQSLAATTIIAALAAASAAPAAELTIYAGAEADNIKFFSEEFSKAHPDITLNWIRDSSGVIQARVLAEKDNPRADVLFAMTATSMINFADMGLLEPYTPAGADAISPAFQDSADQRRWVGIYGWASTICYNHVEGEKLGVPQPSSWADLTDPAYKGQVIMPNPASAGTGFLMVAAWIKMMGEEQAWAFMDALDENVAFYSHSGSEPCMKSGTGEYVVGLSFPYRAALVKGQGAPIEIVMPTEGSGWEMQTMAILKGTKESEAAQVFLDWAVTPEAMKAYGSRYGITTLPVESVKPEFFPKDVASDLISVDFQWAAHEQGRILAEWTKRYDQKSAPRN